MTKYKEPWRVECDEGDDWIVDADGERVIEVADVIFGPGGSLNAPPGALEWIVACVNFCRELPTTIIKHQMGHYRAVGKKTAMPKDSVTFLMEGAILAEGGDYPREAAGLRLAAAEMELLRAEVDNAQEALRITVIDPLRAALAAAEKRHKRERGMILVLADELGRYTGRPAPEMERWAEAEEAKGER